MCDTVIISGMTYDAANGAIAYDRRTIDGAGCHTNRSRNTLSRSIYSGRGPTNQTADSLHDITCNGRRNKMAIIKRNRLHTCHTLDQCTVTQSIGTFNRGIGNCQITDHKFLQSLLRTNATSQQRCCQACDATAITTDRDDIATFRRCKQNRRPLVFQCEMIVQIDCNIAGIIPTGNIFHSFSETGFGRNIERSKSTAKVHRSVLIDNASPANRAQRQSSVFQSILIINFRNRLKRVFGISARYAVHNRSTALIDRTNHRADALIAIFRLNRIELCIGYRTTGNPMIGFRMSSNMTNQTTHRTIRCQC